MPNDDDHDLDIGDAGKASAPAGSIPPDYASESVVSTNKQELLLGGPPPARPFAPISSTPLELAGMAAPGSDPPPSSAQLHNVLRRDRGGMPVSKLVGIGCAIFVAVVGLTLLLLFR